MIVVGIDPGLGGAIAVLDDGGDLTVVDMPVLEVGSRGRREVSAANLARVVEAHLPIDICVVERVAARPGQGVVGVFSFGRSLGVVLGVLAALNVPVEMVTPQAWKKAMHVGKGKDAARQRASELLPGHAAQWSRIRDHGRAEAVLLAHHGQRQLAAEAPRTREAA